MGAWYGGCAVDAWRRLAGNGDARAAVAKPNNQKYRAEFRSAPRQEVAMKYVDGFVVPVPKKKLDDYKKISRKMGKIMKEHGALDYVECVAEDVKKGKVTSFPQAVRLKRTEVVVFSWISFKTRKHRDKVWEKTMNDPRMKDLMDPKGMPFDGQRMFFGGFDVMVKY
jgi:uncharacterized protein YbaA (DUF1428 family)